MMGIPDRWGPPVILGAMSLAVCRALRWPLYLPRVTYVRCPSRERDLGAASSPERTLRASPTSRHPPQAALAPRTVPHHGTSLASQLPWERGLRSETLR